MTITTTSVGRPAIWSTVAIAAALTLGACGSAPEPSGKAYAAGDVLTTTTITTTTVAATSTAVETTVARSTSTASSTTTTSTTSTTLPQPIAPPADEWAAEPVIELGTLSIPAIGVEMTMYEGIRLSTLDYGPGHWPGSAMPGQPGNVVVGGHRTSKHRVFRNVDQLQPGDEIIFRDPDGTEHRYVVNRTEVVTPDAIWIINPTPTPTATLFACHPPGSTRERIVVFADLAT